MISAATAKELIFSRCSLLESEQIPLQESLGRYLSAPVAASIDLPPFDNSAMDGFAVRSKETPASFKVVQTIAAGDPPGQIAPGEAGRIMTGAPIPEGADAVVPFEEATTEGDFCIVSRPVIVGKHIRRTGEDVKQNEPVLKSGTRLTSRPLALLAALGVETVDVIRKPRVHIVSTGSEIVERGQPLRPGQIYNSNGPALVAALAELGIHGVAADLALDTEEVLERALKAQLQVDVLITIGGVSAGDFDLVPQVLKKLGAEVIFHKVAIKPGKPLLYATLVRAGPRACPDKGGHRGPPLHIFGLPGNPVSALMVFDRFVRPALLRMMGALVPDRPRRLAVAMEDLKGSEGGAGSGKEDSLRGIVEYHDGRYLARSAGPQGSAHLKPLAASNAVLIIPESKSLVKQGETLEVELLEECP